MIDILKETIIPTKTFKEVHEDIDNEQLFLKKDHNIESFKEKATFLENVGFTNSIATKLYKAVADNHSVVQSYDMKYKGLYKFILEPQLERICEKYNLFVRRPELFLGDIPESNINDIRNFSVYAEDVLDDLFGLLNENLPDYIYFGSIDGDSSDFGYWVDEESILEDEHRGIIYRSIRKPGHKHESMCDFFLRNVGREWTMYRNVHTGWEELWRV